MLDGQFSVAIQVLSLNPKESQKRLELETWHFEVLSMGEKYKEDAIQEIRPLV